MKALRFAWQFADVYPIIQALDTKFKIEVLHTTDSTNTQLMSRLRQGETTPTILIAEEQTAGKGRADKCWRAQVGHSLTFSVLLPVHSDALGWVALVCACSLTEAIQKALPSASNDALKIKWPNDLWIRPQTELLWHKLAGILIETATIKGQRYAVIGVGINVESFATQQVMDIQLGSLKQMGLNWDITRVFSYLAPQLVQDVYNFSKNDVPYWKIKFEHYDVLANQPVYTSNGVQGIGAGISSQGHFLLQTQEGIQAIHSGEISIRPCLNI